MRDEDPNEIPDREPTVSGEEIMPAAPESPSAGSEEAARPSTPKQLSDKTSAGIGPDGTWSDDDAPSPESSAPVVRERDLEQQRHENHLQSRLLIGIGGGIVFTLVIVVLATGFGAISEDFGKTLAQMIIPALIGFIGAVVGTLFRGK